MSREDMQRTIDFILNQQAQFATNIQLLRETQTQLVISQGKAEARMDRIEEVVLRSVVVIERLADAMDRTDGSVAEIAGSVAAIADAQAQTEASIRKLADAQARTEVSMADA